MSFDDVMGFFAVVLFIGGLMFAGGCIYKNYVEPETMENEIRTRINEHREALGLELLGDDKCPFCLEVKS